jgi:catechol 2,3-dioxygenase-like lactoylglutathione lyase family enzyme
VCPSGAIHHLDLTVCDLDRSTAFYDRVLARLGFRRIPDCPEGPLWAGAQVEVGLQAARPEKARPHDRYSPGLHHLAFTAPTRAAVDALHRDLVAMGVAILDPPAEYPGYAPGYYAVFFSDPDGIKLEYVHTPRWPA